MLYLGDFPVNGVVSFLWNTNAGDGSSITRATDGTLKIHKTNSNTTTWQTERSSLNGVTQVEDFEATGIHAVRIDLSDNTDSGFYAAGNEYQVLYSGMGIDGKTVNAVVAHFSIERSGGVLALLKDIFTGSGAGTRVMTLKQLDIENSTGDAIIAKSTGSNGNGINASGNGSGDGIKTTGGATGAGLHAIGGGTSGAGLKAEAANNGHGIHGLGGSTVGVGILGEGQADSDGIAGTGAGTGHGLAGYGGVDGIHGESGTGVNITAVNLVNVQGIKKNTALSNFEFLMFDSAGDPKTGLTVTAERSIDGAAFGSCANSAAEVSNGVYKINLANTDLNGDVITFKFTGTGAKATYVTVKTVQA